MKEFGQVQTQTADGGSDSPVLKEKSRKEKKKLVKVRAADLQNGNVDPKHKEMLMKKLRSGRVFRVVIKNKNGETSRSFLKGLVRTCSFAKRKERQQRRHSRRRSRRSVGHSDHFEMNPQDASCSRFDCPSGAAQPPKQPRRSYLSLRRPSWMIPKGRWSGDTKFPARNCFSASFRRSTTLKDAVPPRNCVSSSFRKSNKLIQLTRSLRRRSSCGFGGGNWEGEQPAHQTSHTIDRWSTPNMGGASLSCDQGVRKPVRRQSNDDTNQ